MKILYLYFTVSLQLTQQVLLLSNIPWGGKRLFIPIHGTSPLYNSYFFYKTSLKSFLDLIYFSSQSQIDTGNKQYALVLLLSNLVCTVINLHNVSQTGLRSLMTPHTPLGILVGKNWCFSGQISHSLVYEPSSECLLRQSFKFGPRFLEVASNCYLQCCMVWDLFRCILGT